ncbi:MAG: hypothetical protein LBP55_03445 [Candidatus Adiutrix sp.]|jgi:hypothetical protein|nr:hypothetical protein [Candidatus Adiutrix sp.]
MNTVVKHEMLYQLISELSAEATEQAIDYVEYLAAREAKENIDDMAYIEAVKDEESIPLEDALQGLGL